jgi:hypothetical protein
MLVSQGAWVLALAWLSAVLWWSCMVEKSGWKAKKAKAAAFALHCLWPELVLENQAILAFEFMSSADASSFY